MKSKVWTIYLPGFVYSACYEYKQPITRRDARDDIMLQMYGDARKRLPRGTALLPERH